MLSSHNFHVIGLTETRIMTGNDPVVNSDIPGQPISTFDVGWQPEILSPIARLPAGLCYSILSPQNMRAFQRTGSRIFRNEKLPQSHSIYLSKSTFNVQNYRYLR